MFKKKLDQVRTDSISLFYNTVQPLSQIKLFELPFPLIYIFLKFRLATFIWLNVRMKCAREYDVNTNTNTPKPTN